MTIEQPKKLNLSCTSFSFVIELENLRYAKLDITKTMLQKVAKQIIDISENLSARPEFIILYNKQVIADYNIEEFVKDALGSCISLIDLKITSTSNLNYFEQRNYGADLCNNEILIFIDCDVIPDDGWLINLLLPFNDPEISVVGGLSYVNPISSVEKGFSLVWIFPPKNDIECKTARLSICIPDNAAFRRKVFVENNFPQTPSYRGTTVDHCILLQSNGYKIMRQPKSRVEHVSYNGFRHLVIRSLCDGHDKYLAWCGFHDKYLENSPKQKHSIITFYREEISHFKERKKYINVSTRDKFGIFYVAATFYGFMMIGAVLTLISPRIIKGTIRI